MSVPKDVFHSSEFVDCARYGELDDMKAMIAEYKEQQGLSELSSATLRDLYSRKAPPSSSTALHMASANNHVAVISYLLEHLTPDSVNLQNDDGATSLHWACVNGHKDAVALLLKAGADPTIKNLTGRSSVTLAE